LSGQGLFDALWSESASENDDLAMLNEDLTNVHSPKPVEVSLSEAALAARESLWTAVSEAYAQDHLLLDYYHRSSADEGADTLIHSLGSVQANGSAYWILQLQSSAARSWLFDIWRKALNPECEVAKQLARLESKSHLQSPSNMAEKVTEPSLQFLKSSCPHWRRYAFLSLTIHLL
jgi:hypothetical protein